MLRSAKEVRAHFIDAELIRSGRRGKAVMEVLQRMPEVPYRVLVTLDGTFHWFLPNTELGAVMRFPLSRFPPEGADGKPWVRVVYLAPSLEAAPWDIVVGTAVHELAHVYLHHDLELPIKDAADGKRKEDEVFHTICRWGFEQEARALERRSAPRRKVISANVWVDACTRGE